MRVLVTGGAGFIGSHLVDRLVDNNHQVLIVDDLSSGRKEYINPRAEFTRLDIRNSKLGELVAKFKPDVIYHLAAQKNVRVSLENPVFDAEVNILGSLNLLQIAINNKVNKFIFISTGGIYGNTDSLPTNESGEEKPLSPYILNKLTFEKYLIMLAGNKLKWIILRPANVYGPRQDPHGEAGVISIFLNNIIKGEALKINGDGKQTRDFIYVDDVVDALLKSLDAEEGIYNIGTSRETSLLDLIEIMKKIAKRDIKVIHCDAIIGEVKRSSLNTDKARRSLNWQPKYDLNDGINLTYNWFKNETSNM